jgi:hypothetical protein
MNTFNMSSAQARVFAISELFEAILAELPPFDLLFAQSISRKFRTAITTSPKLQRLLFLRAAPLKDAQDWTLNPLLKEEFVPWLRE